MQLRGKRTKAQLPTPTLHSLDPHRLRYIIMQVHLVKLQKSPQSVSTLSKSLNFRVNSKTQSNAPTSTPSSEPLYIALAVLEVAIQIKLVSNSQITTCFYLQSSKIKGVCTPVQFLNGKPCKTKKQITYFQHTKAQNIHHCFKREEREHSEEIIDGSGTNSKSCSSMPCQAQMALSLDHCSLQHILSPGLVLIPVCSQLLLAGVLGSDTFNILESPM